MICFGALLMGCAKKTTTTPVTIQMKNIDAVRSLLKSPSENESKNTSKTRSNIRTFTPSVFKFPIKRITLVGSGGLETATVYECSGTTAAECLVDLADPVAVSALIPNPVSVTYEVGSTPTITGFQVTVDPTCDSGSMTPFDIKVKGSYQIAATTYYTTNSQATLFSTSESDNEEVGVGTSTCTMNWDLPSPASVTGTDQTISLFVTVKDLAYGDHSASNAQPFCESKGTSSLCVPGLAVPYPYVGAGNPTMTSYTLNEAGVGKARVHMAILDSTPVGAFIRPVFDGSFAEASHCYAASWLDSFVDNGDSTYQFNVAEGSYNWELFNAFQLANHSGTCKSRDQLSTYNYSATLDSF